MEYLVCVWLASITVGAWIAADLVSDGEYGKAATQFCAGVLAGPVAVIVWVIAIHLYERSVEDEED